MVQFLIKYQTNFPEAIVGRGPDTKEKMGGYGSWKSLKTQKNLDTAQTPDENKQ